MKQYEDKHRSERKLEVGDWVYLKLQPYRQVTVAGLRNQKLSPKYYGPFEVIQKIGMVAYKLNLPPSLTIHPVFHISQLKKKVGSNQPIHPMLPLLGPGIVLQPSPELVLAKRMVKRRNATTPQVLVKWYNQPEKDATWEDYDHMAKEFSEFIREDTNFTKGEGLLHGPIDLGITVAFSEFEMRKEKEGERVRHNGQPVLIEPPSDDGPINLENNVKALFHSEDDKGAQGNRNEGDDTSITGEVDSDHNVRPFKVCSP